MRLAFAVAVTTLISGALPVDVADKYGVTAQEHDACDGDAVRLCSAALPDEDKLFACMRLNRDRLGDLCASTIRAGLLRRHMPAWPESQARQNKAGE